MNALSPITASTWASPVLCASFHRINDAYDRLQASPFEADHDRAAHLMSALDAIEEADAALQRAEWLEFTPMTERGDVGRSIAA